MLIFEQTDGELCSIVSVFVLQTSFTRTLEEERFYTDFVRHNFFCQQTISEPV